MLKMQEEAERVEEGKRDVRLGNKFGHRAEVRWKVGRVGGQEGVGK